MSGSKTVYYVSSSTSAIFDPKTRVRYYPAALLDYTSTSPIELSEYMRQFYDVSRLKHIRNFMRQADASGFHDKLGRVSSNFYGDATFNNTTITNAIKQYFSFSGDEKIEVYQTTLNFFNEDFFIKHLATQQNLTNLVYLNSDSNYTLEQSGNTIEATFEDGTKISGTVPSFEANTRFLEISFTRTKNKEIMVDNPNYVPPSPEVPENPEESVKPQTENTEETEPVEPEVPPEPEFIPVDVLETIYGYFYYQEGTGNSTLDNLIKNNGSQVNKSFYPVIPLRTNTAWFTGEKANLINEALKYLEIYDNKKGKNSAYQQMIDNCSNGLEGGSIKDVDYATLILGVSINSNHNADQKYIFEFFYNCYYNYALANGLKPQTVTGGYSLTTGKGYLTSFLNKIINKFNSANHSNAYYSRFQISNPTTNLNLFYTQGASEYFIASGKQRPEAVPGDYGVLAGELKYEQTETTPKRDSKGNIVYTFSQEKGYEMVTETVTKSTKINVMMFCKQETVDTQKFLLFTDLGLQNLVYAGKSIYTNAYNAIVESNNCISIVHDFTTDSGGGSSNLNAHLRMSLKYIDSSSEKPSAFIVPLEKNTFQEIGYTDQYDISYGCQFLIFNAQVKKKIKQYQRGQFAIAFCFLVAVPLGIALGLPTVTAAFATIGAVLATAKAIQLLEQTLSLIFGDRQGHRLTNQVVQIIKGVIQIVATIASYIGFSGIPIISQIAQIVYAICVAIYFIINAAELLQKGASLSEAFKQSLKNTAVMGISSAVSGYVMGAVSPAGSTGAVAGSSTESAALGAAQQSGTQIGFGSMLVNASSSLAGTGAMIAGSAASGFTAGALASWFNGESLGTSLKKGLVQGGISGAGAYLQSQFMASNGKVNFSAQESTVVRGVMNFAVASISSQLLNPMTFANLLGMTIEEQMFHKLANLENDYQEFSNMLQAAQDVLYQVSNTLTCTLTAELVCLFQNTLGRRQNMFPESTAIQDPDSIISMSTLTGHDICKVVLAVPETFCENKLTMTGFTPYELHYSKFGYTSTQDLT